MQSCAGRFMAGDDAEATARRDSMFKLIPSIIKGSWVIKQSVGHTPVILGRKLKTHYFRWEQRYFNAASQTAQSACYHVHEKESEVSKHASWNATCVGMLMLVLNVAEALATLRWT